MLSDLNLFQRFEFDDAKKHNKSIGDVRKSFLVKGVILVLSLLICTFFISYKPHQINTNQRLNYTTGFKWTDKNLIAETNFPIYKNKRQYLQEVKIARENSFLVFKNKYTKEDILQSIRNYQLSDNTIDILRNDNYFIEYESLFDSLKALKAIELNNLLNTSKDFVSNYYRSKKGLIINYDITKIKSEQILINNDLINSSLVNKMDLIDSVSYFQNLNNYIVNRQNKINQLFSKYLVNRFIKPELFYSPELTKEERLYAENSISKTLGLIKKGEIIVSKGHILSDMDILKLDSYFYFQNVKNKNQSNITTYISNFAHISLIFSFILLYLFNIRKRIFYDNNQFGAIFLIFVITSFQAWISVEYDFNYPMEYLIFLPAYSMLAAIVFDSRTAFYATVTMALLVASIRGNDYITAVVMMFSGSVAAYTVRDIQNRTQMLKSIILIFSAFVLTIFTFGIDVSLSSPETLQKLMFCAINALVSPLITFGLLFVMEKTTNFSSNLMYQEYDNINHPLLKELSQKAPGTFQHVKGVAALSEACAEAIEANVLFVRVASYFHDIGKIYHPEYFAENQIDMDSKHLKIPPKRSAKTIINHVIEGAALARKSKLPERIIDIIYMHHGTTLVKHFYAMSLEQNTDTDPKDFQYPGPKPNSKEAAIIMICDAAEAISRLPIHDDEEMEKMLDNIIRDRVDEGQFDDCDITIRELQIIKFTILKNIKAIHHSRVTYKEVTK